MSQRGDVITSNSWEKIKLAKCLVPLSSSQWCHLRWILPELQLLLFTPFHKKTMQIAVVFFLNFRKMYFCEKLAWKQPLGQYWVVGGSSSYLLQAAPGPPQADPGPPASGSGTGCLHRLASSRGNPPPAPARPLHTRKHSRPTRALNAFLL